MWKAKERFFSGSKSLRFDMPVYHKGAIHFVSDFSPYLYKSCLWRRILKIRVRAMEVLEKDPYQIVVKSFMVLNEKFLVFTIEEKIYLYGLLITKFINFGIMKVISTFCVAFLIQIPCALVILEHEICLYLYMCNSCNIFFINNLIF
ncbi:hypothetical protein V8G54_007204 [Vigna mungo]|uniref:Uncharacterized protein n=1 Tax=Vigna mungo TaxID=3915 RepID=A0AAQ3P3K8_VIGMU